MSRQEVNIGVVGNDGTGDSIREAFRKVNDNFKEIYAVFNLGESISFQDLDNVPNELDPNRVITTDDTGIGIRGRELIEGEGINIDISDPDKIIIAATGTNTTIANDTTPRLGGPLNGYGFPIGKIAEPSQDAVNAFNTAFGSTGWLATINDLAITKGYADRYYLRKTGSSSSGEGQVRVRSEPVNINAYNLIIDGFNNGNLVINNHGFDAGVDGASFVYSSTGINANNLYSNISVGSPFFMNGRYYKIISKGTTDWLSLGALRGEVGEIFKLVKPTIPPAPVTIISSGGPATSVNNVIDGGTPNTTVFSDTIDGGVTIPNPVPGGGIVRQVYYIKYVNSNQLSVHPTFEDAQTNLDKINVSLGSGTGVHSLTDASYTSTLPGNWLSNEVLPRNSVVRRQGDVMTGALTLSDHPYPLNGVGTPNTPYDLQAATKLYVDNTSYTSPYNLFVSNNGRDVQADTPEGKEGSSWAYAFASIGKACERAEFLMNNSPIEPGPYRQTIIYTKTVNGQPVQTKSVVTTFNTIGSGGLIRLRFTNNGGNNVDQGDPTQVEIIPGKLIRGMLSGATGYVYNYELDGSSLVGEDFVDLEYVRGTFIEGENIEFGDPVKALHISIYVESGIYEEDYPIRVPANTAILGDEFRRVLVRPRDRISQSPWVDTWFFRNTNFDDLNIVSGGTQLDSQAEGWYGYHYYKDPDRLTNRGPSYTNVGNYTAEATAIAAKRFEICQDIKLFVENRVFLTTAEQTKTLRDTGYIVDAIVSDLKTGGMSKIMEIQELFSTVPLSTDCKAGILEIANNIKTEVIASGSATVKTLITNMINKILFVYEIDTVSGQPFYNTPKNNKDIDVFMVNDATIIRQITCQGHGGFMMVLDPNGQILSKSPYCQQSGSFAASINKKSFRGGQYIDGFTGNLKPQVTAKASNVSITITGVPREPLTPTSFFIEGKRYKVNTYRNTGDINGSDLIKANKNFLILQTLNELKKQYSNIKIPLFEVRSLLDKIVDALIFDIVNTGNAKTVNATKRFFNLSNNNLRLAESLKPLLVSMLSYVKDTARLIANNATVIVNQTDITQFKNANRPGQAGTQTKINVLLNNVILCIENGINNLAPLDYPIFTLIIDSATPLPNAFQPPTMITLITPGNTSMLANDYTQVNDLGYGVVTNNNGLSECVSVFSYYCWTGMFSNNGGQIRSLNSSSAHGEFGLVSSGSDPLEIPDPVSLADNSVQVAKVEKSGTYLNSGQLGATFFYIKNFQYIPYNVSIIEVNHGPLVGFVRYELNNIQVAARDPITNAPTVIRVNFGMGLKATLNNDDRITIRAGQNFKFTGVEQVNPTRPSTALTFLGDATNNEFAPVYRVINYSTKGPDGLGLSANEAILTFDSTYNYISLSVDKTRATLADGVNPGKTLGATAGDVRIAVASITSDVLLARLNTAQMLFAWDGKIHRIISYSPNTNYGIITISNDTPSGTPLPNVNSAGNGIITPLIPANNPNINQDADAEVTLLAGLAAGEPADITVRISTMRATGHDFLEIGTGGYNTTNYPSKIYGDPKDPSQGKEVKERGKGRVFYVSTDQDGFFRVGRFFTVDQGTGTVSFSASIALTSLDGLGFKKGVFVTKFSNDDEFVDLAPDSVPTEQAVSGYIDRRLGLTRGGQLVDSTDLYTAAPGFIDRKGKLGPLADIDFGGNRITNLGDPSGPEDAISKKFLETEVSKYSTLKKLKDTYTNNTAQGDIMIFADQQGSAFSATISGDLTGSINSTYSAKLKLAIPLSGSITSIEIDDATQFRTEGYVLINQEIFYYDGKTITAGNDILSGVVRLSLQPNTTSLKLAGATRSAHNFNDTVYSLDEAILNLQLKPNIIVNADINNLAGISQSKLALNLTTTSATAPSLTSVNSGTFVVGKRYRITSIGTSDFTLVGANTNSIGEIFQATGPGAGNGTAIDMDALQSTAGLVTFDSTNFEITDGWVGIKNGGVTRQEQANVTAYRVIGNLTNAATFPQELAPEDVLKQATFRAIEAETAGPGLPGKDYVFTINRGSGTGEMASSTFKASQVNVSVVNNAIIRRGNTGNTKIKILETDGGVPIIDAAGTVDSATPVTYKGQWTPGTDATLHATSATTATSATSATSATTATKWLTARKITLGGDATGEVSIDGSGDVTLTMSVSAGSAGTANSLTNSVTFNNSGTGDSSGTTFNGATAKTISYNTIGAAADTHTHTSLLSLTTVSTGNVSTAGTITGAWSFTSNSSLDVSGTGVNFKSRTLDAGSKTTTGLITGVWSFFDTSSLTLDKGSLTLTSGNLSVGGNASVTGTLGVTGNATMSGTLGVTGAVTLGNNLSVAGTLSVTGNTSLSGDLTMGAKTLNLSSGTLNTRVITTGASATTGSITGTWSLTAGSSLQATYADIAEYYTADNSYEPGTVLVFGGQAEVTMTKTFGDTRVAGVVTTNPAYVMNTELKDKVNSVCIALQGRVPVKVVGRISKGDLLTTAGVFGHAARAINPAVGTIIGKALENKDTTEAGIIEVAVGRF